MASFQEKILFFEQTVSDLIMKCCHRKSGLSQSLQMFGCYRSPSLKPDLVYNQYYSINSLIYMLTLVRSNTFMFPCVAIWPTLCWCTVKITKIRSLMFPYLETSHFERPHSATSHFVNGLSWHSVEQGMYVLLLKAFLHYLPCKNFFSIISGICSKRLGPLAWKKWFLKEDLRWNFLWNIWLTWLPYLISSTELRPVNRQYHDMLMVCKTKQL